MARQKKFLAEKPSKDKMFIKAGSKPSSINDALKDVHKAGEYTGFLGEGNIVKKPDYIPPPENLDAEGIARKKAITSLLMGVIEPVQLSMRSTPEADRRSLLNKLKKSSLDELKKFLPDHIKRMPTEKLIVESVTEEEKLEIQNNYKEISP